MQKTLMGLFLLVVFAAGVPADDLAPTTPRLLLSTQRLRRLKRDRERKTPRWVAFENRVNSVPDSTERGFELALYYAITGDEAKGREAIDWAIKNKSFRLSALVVDWCAPLITPRAKQLLLVQVSSVAGYFSVIKSARDQWFSQLAFGPDIPKVPDLSAEMDHFMARGYRGPDELYALCELIYAVRANTRTDLREPYASFFSTLPELLLLSAKPAELEKPEWQMHAAALSLVAIDPNLPASQFLQSWALEDSQTIREGPGVAYELLWADPYLPGVGYQNMDTWVYEEHAGLFARASWEPNSCWIEISNLYKKEAENCPPNWEAQTVNFGHLTLIPMTDRCIDIPHLTDRNQSVLVWKLKPGEGVTHGKGKDARTSPADAVGIWRPGAAVEGKVCVSGH